MIVRKSVFNRFLRRLSLSDKFRVEDLEVEVATSEQVGTEMMSPEAVQGSNEREDKVAEEVVEKEVTNL